MIHLLETLSIPLFVCKTYSLIFNFYGTGLDIFLLRNLSSLEIVLVPFFFPSFFFFPSYLVLKLMFFILGYCAELAYFSQELALKIFINFRYYIVL